MAILDETGNHFVNFACTAESTDPTIRRISLSMSSNQMMILLVFTQLLTVIDALTYFIKYRSLISKREPAIAITASGSGELTIATKARDPVSTHGLIRCNF